MPRSAWIWAMAAVLATTATAAVTSSADAHTTVRAIRPGIAPSLPARVVLDFTGPIRRVEALRVTRSGRNHAVSVRITGEGRRRVIVTTAPGPPGGYRVSWRVVAGDGHRARGTRSLFFGPIPQPCLPGASCLFP